MANLLADALLKVGLVTEEQITKVQKETVTKSVEPQKEYHSSEPKTIEQSPDESVISKLWNEPKSHKFIVHLIHTFVPFYKGQFAWSSEDLHQNTCCICKQKLMTKEDVFSKNEELATVSLEQMRLRIKNELTAKKVTEDFNRIFDGHVLGIVSSDSDAAFCNQCFQDFANWIQNMTIRGNYEINKIIRHQMKIQSEKQIESTLHENRI